MSVITDLLKLLKVYFVPLIVRWVLKIAGTYFAMAGFTENDVLKLVGGIVAVIIGIITSLINKKSDLDAPPVVK